MSDRIHPFEPPRFGTDGLRGPAGTAPMDRETLRRVGASLGLWLQKHGPEHKRVVVGHDGRASAEWILQSLARGLAAAEVAVSDIGLVTTPALAFVARTEPFAAGIMISASHNPVADNGIKIFDGAGGKLDDDAEAEIAAVTAVVDASDDRPAAVAERPHLVDRYVEDLANTFGHLDLGGRRIAVDAAHGGGARIAPVVLRGLGAEIVTTGCAPDGGNINDGVGTLHPEHLAGVVRESGADLGLSLDGDGDRSIFVDETGAVRDGDAILALLGRSLKARGALPHDTVVATVMSNLGLRRALAAAGVDLHTTPVGDRNVIEAMRAGGYALGGEQSGHIVLAAGGRFTGDGLYTALALLDLPELAAGPVSAAFAGFRRFPQVLRNVAVRSKPELGGLPGVAAARRRVEERLGDDGRVVLRYSGTEALCRVMVEGPEEPLVTDLVDELASAVAEALS